MTGAVPAAGDPAFPHDGLHDDFCMGSLRRPNLIIHILLGRRSRSSLR